MISNVLKSSKDNWKKCIILVNVFIIMKSKFWLIYLQQVCNIRSYIQMWFHIKDFDRKSFWFENHLYHNHISNRSSSAIFINSVTQLSRFKQKELFDKYIRFVICHYLDLLSELILLQGFRAYQYKLQYKIVSQNQNLYLQHSM